MHFSHKFGVSICLGPIATPCYKTCAFGGPYKNITIEASLKYYCVIKNFFKEKIWLNTLKMLYDCCASGLNWIVIMANVFISYCTFLFVKTVEYLHYVQMRTFSGINVDDSKIFIILKTHLYN
ncbi:hypothetical protein KUTeg_002016 [Tegillarca granosa]|uniref:Uncharacterized protein n=1 Tax=Tegillarca granosa TaxID=220873 RepID=A0ABQ9FT48_TEGGR|nr:hypothetical protein KUTeg_002016 [Tegillarca granosa]